MKRPEQQIHRACVEYLTLLESQKRLTFFHPYNGGWRTPAEGRIGKTLGVRAGIPDLVLILPGSKVAFIEVKSGTGKATNNQIATMAALNHFGAPTAIVRSVTELEEIIKQWGI